MAESSRTRAHGRRQRSFRTPDRRKEQGDEVAYILMGLTAGNAASFRSGVVSTGIEVVLVLPAVTVVSILLVLHFVTDSRMFRVGSLFQRRCGVCLASCCGSGNPMPSFES